MGDNKRIHVMSSPLKIAATFLVALLVMTIGCTVVWQQFVTDTLYHCTDAGWLDYLSPGHWIHNPETVGHGVHNRAMSELDTIRAGWSMAGLWSLWYSFASVSVVVSVLFARMSWRPKHPNRHRD
jgi:hypothetical protein